MPEFDYLIVGQGLAGTTLALSLIDRGKNVLVIDNSHHQSSSMVAAGMWNPIVFRKLNKSWRVDDLLPAMTDFYSRWEKEFDQKFLHFKDIARIFPALDFQNDWLAKSADQGYEQYLSDDEHIDLSGIKLRFDRGFGLVKNSGYLDVASFLLAAKEWLIKKSSLICENLSGADLKISDAEVTIGGHTAGQIIFCEGFQGAGNRWFEKLPFGNTKGELLTIKAEGLPEAVIPNLGVWMLPVGNHHYKVGATFDWQDKTTDFTEKAKEKIQHELGQLTDVIYTIVRQQAGIRPTSQDRRPMVGMHREHPQIGIFNGLGTKGVMNAPWCAQRFCDYLIDGTPLPSDIDVNRLTY